MLSEQGSGRSEFLADFLATPEKGTGDSESEAEAEAAAAARVAAAAEGGGAEDTEWELRAAASVADAAQLFRRKLVKINRRNKYEQQKFNLYREESEGYAKLLTLLTSISDRLNVSEMEGVASQIQSLIGFFHLDPNRVLDVLLEA